MVSEKTLESPLDCKEIQLVYPKGNQSWIFIGTSDAEAPILWPYDVNNWLIWKDSDAGKDWKWKEKGITEDEMVGWHHQLNGREFEQTPGVGDGQEGLACCSPWGHRELDMTKRLNWSNYQERDGKMGHQESGRFSSLGWLRIVPFSLWESLNGSHCFQDKTKLLSSAPKNILAPTFQLLLLFSTLYVWPGSTAPPCGVVLAIILLCFDLLVFVASLPLSWEYHPVPIPNQALPRQFIPSLQPITYCAW